MISDLILLFYFIILISVLGLFCHFLVLAIEKIYKSQVKRERRAEIRSAFKREINALRNDDGVYSEFYTSSQIPNYLRLNK